MEPGVYTRGKYNAKERLLEVVPDAEKRFNRYCKGLKKLLEDVNKHFPDAHYFVVSDHIVLDLWHKEALGPISRNEAQALSYSRDLHITGGDY